MPLYEYQCKKCGKVFEAMQKFSDEPLKKHEKCGGKLEKLMSAPAFHLKGSGWYVTDYGKGGVIPKEPSASDSKSESSSDSSSDTTSESKTETKAETKTESKPPKKESKTAAAKAD
jgi:putative FmdB family regulatory protein